MTGRTLLRKYLRQTHQTLAELSRNSGVDDGLLNRLVSGKRKPGLETAAKLEKVTGIPATSWVE